MEITIKGDPKEIAELVPELQTRLKKVDNILGKQLELLSTVSEICSGSRVLIPELPGITHAMVELHSYMGLPRR